MKILLALVAVLAAALMLRGAGAPPVTYANAEKVAEALAKGQRIASQPDYLVSGAHRDKAGQVEVHDKETDVIYITDGEATFVTGGTMIGGSNTKAGQWLGKDIQGGETRHLSKGDVVVIPAGTPHWFKEVPKSVNYFLVKIIKE